MPVLLSEIINQNKKHGSNNIKASNIGKNNYTMIDELVQGFEQTPMTQYNSNDALTIETNLYKRTKNKLAANIPDDYVKNNNLTNYLAKAPTSSDILAILPVKTSVGIPTGSLLVEFSGSLQDSARTYFGPVNIERLAVKLLDDKGNVLNLNGNDWCVSLIAECLYQY